MITRTTWGQEKQEDVTLYLFYEFEAYTTTTISFITSTEEAMEKHINDTITNLRPSSIAYDAYFSVGRFNERGILETESIDTWVVVHESTDDLGQMPKRYRVFLNRNRALEWMKEQRDRMPDNVKTTHLWNGDADPRYRRYFKGFEYDYKTYTSCGQYLKHVCNERFTIEAFLGGGSLS